ncbi:MAG: NAD(P)H-dependent oxidoreductase [Steroidobacteraceae bacterium]|jgi:FMN-dependent NADH-azoreductase
MTTLLQIKASISHDQGLSSQLANNFVAAYRKAHSDTHVVVREVASAEPVPHLNGERFGAFIAKPEARTDAQHAVVAYSDALIEELKRADIVVLGLPMYNFGVPSQLKAYFDHIARAGVTFKYTATGPVGLLTGKKVYVFAARGGLYAGSPLDTQTGYVRDFLAFLGMKDVQFVYAEGLAVSPESREAGLARAAAEIAALAA